MSQENKSSAATPELAASESNLGLVLALIHRVLPQLSEPEKATSVQAALRKAASLIEAARDAHAHEMGVAAGSTARTTVEAEIVAVIAAAIAATLGRPYKLVSVQPASIPVPHYSAWALEGRTQIFSSHRIR